MTPELTPFLLVTLRIVHVILINGLTDNNTNRQSSLHDSSALINEYKINEKLNVRISQLCETWIPYTFEYNKDVSHYVSHVLIILNSKTIT